MFNTKILIPEEVKEKYRAEARKIVKDKQRSIFIDLLSKFEKQLDEFEQTTHHHIGFGTIDFLLDDLKDFWTDPTALTTSNLSQTIRRFIEEYEKTKDSI